MIWLILTVLGLANASSDRVDLLTSSISDAARTGAAIVSSFLHRNPSAFLLPVFHKEYRGGGRGGNDQVVLALLKLVGIDYRRISDFAFDGIISLVRLMSQVLIKGGERRSRTGRRASGEGVSWFRLVLRQPQVADLLEHMQDPNLVDLILKESREKMKNAGGENVECIRLLVCKAKPFVRGMQRSLRFFMKRENIGASGDEESCGRTLREDSCSSRKGEEEDSWEKASMDARMFFFFPSLGEVVQEGDECDQIFPNCDY